MSMVRWLLGAVCAVTHDRRKVSRGKTGGQRAQQTRPQTSLALLAARRGRPRPEYSGATSRSGGRIPVVLMSRA